MEKFLTAEASKAAVSCLISVKWAKWKSFRARVGAEAKSQESQNLRDLTRLFLAVRKWWFFFVSYSRQPLGPALINLYLSPVTCLHFYLLFWADTPLHFWCEVCVLEVKQKHPRSRYLWNCSFAAQTNRDSSGRLGFVCVWQPIKGHNQKSHANKSDWNLVQNG